MLLLRGQRVRENEHHLSFLPTRIECCNARRTIEAPALRLCNPPQEYRGREKSALARTEGQMAVDEILLVLLLLRITDFHTGVFTLLENRRPEILGSVQSSE